MENTASPQTDIQKLSSLVKSDLLKVAIGYVPENQKSKKGYLNLIMQNNLTYKTPSGTEIGSMEDLVSFLYVCSRTGLDPVAKQVHTQWRWNSKLGKYQMIVVTGIDGFRLTAQRSGEYGGQDDIKFEVEEVFNPIKGDNEKQLKATATIYRINKINGDRMPISASARWNEYVVKDNKGEVNNFWATKPYVMLGKCAEALALRKAFPQELSNLYTQEEVEQTEETKAKLSNLPIPESKVKEPKKEEQAKPIVTNNSVDSKNRLAEILEAKKQLSNNQVKEG